jgi:hypothetical protein
VMARVPWRLVAWLVAILVVVAAISGRARGEAVDVALVIALDVSGSVSEDHWQLQRDGVAEAVGSRQFAAAVSAGQIGRVAVAVVQWGSGAAVAIGWRVIQGPGEASVMAGEIRAMARLESGATCMANALVKSGLALMAWEDGATRRVIDLSGDGADNCNIDVSAARAALLAQGITINGLPIVTSTEPKVDDWYERNVIGGPGAFLIVAEGHGSFAEAFLKKLITETAEVIR